MSAVIQVSLSLAFLAAAVLTFRPHWGKLRREDRMRIGLASLVAIVLFAANGGGIRSYSKMERTFREAWRMDFPRRFGPGYRPAVKAVYPWYWDIVIARNRILALSERSVRLEMRGFLGRINRSNNYQRICEILYPVRINPKARFRLIATEGDKGVKFQIEGDLR